MSVMKILLTGATGFIGSHLLHRLVSDGYSVTILKRSTSDLWRIKDLIGLYESYDIDIQPIDEIFAQIEVDVVMHLATTYRKFDDPSDIESMIDTNVALPSKILSLGVKYNIRAFINTGSFFEYDCSVLPISEEAPPMSFNFYGKTKLAFDTILREYRNQICINSFKLFSPFGEKDNQKLISYIVKNALNDKEICLSEGLQKIDLIYVRDIVDAYILSLKRMESMNYAPEYETFNLGSGFPLSIRDVVSIIEEILDKRVKVEWGSIAENEIPVVFSDITKAKKLLGWTPHYNVNGGMIETIKYMKS